MSSSKTTTRVVDPNPAPCPWTKAYHSEQPYHLDWREGCTKAETLERLWKLQECIDQGDEVNVVLASGLSGRQYAVPRKGSEITKVSRGSQLVLFDPSGKIVAEDSGLENVQRGWVYRLRTCVKKPSRPKDVAYLLKLARIAKKAAYVVDKGEPELRRGAGYDMNSESFDSNEALRVFQDLALTLHIHPTALGIYSASTGEYVVPRGYKLRVTLCNNVFEYNNHRHTRPEAGLTTVNRAGACKIDNMIHSMRLVADMEWDKENKIRAVIVIEHRNLTDMMQRLTSGTSPDWKGLFFVLVS